MNSKQLQRLLKKMEKADALYERADQIYSEVQDEMRAFAEESGE